MKFYKKIFSIFTPKKQKKEPGLAIGKIIKDEKMPENMEEEMARKKEVELTEEQKAKKAVVEEFNAYIKRTQISNPVTASYVRSLEKRIAELEK